MRVLWVTAILLGALRVWITAELPSARWDLCVDDYLYVRSAHHLGQGDWLGPYDQFTLAKLPGYAFFLCAVDLSGIPRRIAEDTAYVLAALALLGALLRLRIGRVLAGACYVAVVFSPAAWAGLLARPVRDGFCMSLAIATLAAAIAHLAPARLAVRGLLGLAAGATFTLFDLTREEGVWLWPPLGILVIALWRAERARGAPRDRRLAAVLLLVVPLAGGLALGRTWLAARNEQAYGIAITCEQFEPAYRSALAALRSFQPEPYERFEPLEAATRRRLYDVSPAFRSLEHAFESDSYHAPNSLTASGERMFAYDAWLLRDAVAGAGHYRTASDAVAFYRRLSDEVRAATAGPISRSSLPVPHPSLFPLLWEHFQLAMRWSVSGSIAPEIWNADRGVAKPEQLDVYAEVLNEPMAVPSGGPPPGADLLLGFQQGLELVLPWIALVASVALVVQIVFRKLVPLEAWLGLQLALVAAILIRLVLVALIETYWWRLAADYLLPIIPLVPVAGLLSLRGLVVTTIHEVRMRRPAAARVMDEAETPAGTVASHPTQPKAPAALDSEPTPIA